MLIGKTDREGRCNVEPPYVSVVQVAYRLSDAGAPNGNARIR